MTTNTDLLRETLTLAERQLRHAGDLLSRLSGYTGRGTECAEVAAKCRVALNTPRGTAPHHAWVRWTDVAPPDYVTLFVRHESRQDLVGEKVYTAASIPAWIDITGLWWKRA